MRIFAAILAALLLGCQSPPPAQAPISRLKINPAAAGTVRGVVLFEGVPPETSKIPLADFAQCANPKERDDDVLIRDGRVQNAFVYVKEGLENYDIPPGIGDVAINQKDCLYVPRVVGLQAGQTLVIRNSDPFLHNVHALPRASAGFNVGMGKGSGDIRRVFDKAEVMVPIRCDVHPWMRAYVGVLLHPYFAITGADGAFEIRGLPPGDYILEAWHERLGSRTFVFSLENGGVREAPMIFK